MSNELLDAITQLEVDQSKIEGMLVRRRQVTGPALEVLIHDICRAVTSQSKVLNEILYPELRSAGVHASLLKSAAVGDRNILSLTEALQNLSHKDCLFDAKVKALADQVRRQSRRLESKLSPVARAASIDLNAIGVQIAARKAELKTAAEAP